MPDPEKLRISDQLSLPPDALSGTQAILAQKGAGKSYAAMKMMEQAVKGGFQAVALDPTGIWYGISAAGDGPALPVLVMGGEHGNVPLESTSGEVVAEFIVDSGRSVVLDLSLMRKAEMHRFLAAFLDKLYHYKATHRENVHVFFDEADTSAPQSPGPEQAKVLGAAEDVVRRGRSRGLGMTLISQRPAVLNKNLLEMCDTLYVMRVVGSNDQDAIRKRVRVDATDEQVAEMMQSLASLENGEAWVWSPAALGIFKRIRFARKQTFDSSRSPKPGERMAPPKARAAIDLGELTARIKATVERAKQNDPAELRRRVAALERQLAERPAEVREVEKIVEVPVLRNGALDRTEKFAGRMEEAGAKLLAEAAELRRLIAPAAVPRPAPAPAIVRTPALRRSPAVQRTTFSGDASDSALGKSGKRRLLVALAQNPDGLTHTKLSLLTGISRSGGTWRTYMGELRGRGWVEDTQDKELRITPNGLDVLGDYDPLPIGEALIEYWRGRLGQSGKRAMFDAAVVAYPKSLTYEQMSAATGIEASGGTWRTYLGELRGLELLTGRGGEIRASDDLFEGSR